MKRISIIVVGTLALALLAYANSRTPKANGKRPTCAQTAARHDTTAEQDRINRYFQREVISKLRGCWKGVQGKGMIQFKFTYTKAGSSWTWNKLGVNHSTLSRGQDAVALRCMQEAVRSTSFHVEEGDLRGGSIAGRILDVHWSFPVPLPTDAADFRRMAVDNGGGTGCDGYGTPGKCIPDCNNPNDPTAPSKCSEEKVCIGVGSCTITADGECKTTACKSGGVFSGSGGVIIY